MSGTPSPTHEVLNQSPPLDVLRALSRERLAGNHGGMYGAVDLASDDVGRLLDRALPQ